MYITPNAERRASEWQHVLFSCRPSASRFRLEPSSSSPRCLVHGSLSAATLRAGRGPACMRACSVATALKEKTLKDINLCGGCQKELAETTPSKTYPCPRRCGLRMCSLACARSHGDTCSRKWWHVPAFGKRFSGKTFPLTRAVGLKGISTQPPLDYEVPGDRWDFRTDDGKVRLDEEEAHGDLVWNRESPS